MSKVIGVETVGDVRVVRLLDAKILDEPQITSIREELFRIATRVAEVGGSLLIDFAGVKFISSSIIGVFLSLHRQCEESSVPLMFCSLNESVREALTLAGLIEIVNVAPTREASLAVLGRTVGRVAPESSQSVGFDRPTESEQNGPAIDRMCEAFAAAWESGSAPRIEDFLGTQADRAEAVYRLLSIELQARSRRQLSISETGYVKRFPQHAEAVHWAFREQAETSDLRSLRTAEEDMPRELGRFRLQQFLGEGGFGKVYRAFETTLDRVVSLKIAKPGAEDALLREARVGAQLQHPRIPTVLSSEMIADRRLIVREYIDGIDFGRLLRSGPIGLQRGLKVTVEICDLVSHLHSRGIIHRDVKPANIVVDGDGHASLTGLSLATEKTELQRASKSQFVGTPQFMAPEQVSGDVWAVDERTDVWGIGVVLCLIATGVFPFGSRRSKETLENILNSEPLGLNGEVPEKLKQSCLRCLAKHKYERYQTVVDLKTSLQSCLNELSDSELAVDRFVHPSTAFGTESSRASLRFSEQTALDDWEWAIEERGRGSFEQWVGKYAGVVGKEVIDVGEEPNRLRESIADKCGVTSERVVVVYVPRGDGFAK